MQQSRRKEMAAEVLSFMVWLVRRERPSSRGPRVSCGVTKSRIFFLAVPLPRPQSREEWFYARPHPDPLPRGEGETFAAGLKCREMDVAGRAFARRKTLDSFF